MGHLSSRWSWVFFLFVPSVIHSFSSHALSFSSACVYFDNLPQKYFRWKKYFHISFNHTPVFRIQAYFYTSVSSSCLPCFILKTFFQGEPTKFLKLTFLFFPMWAVSFFHSFTQHNHWGEICLVSSHYNATIVHIVQQMQLNRFYHIHSTIRRTNKVQIKMKLENSLVRLLAIT